jgi:hypothetical protein
MNSAGSRHDDELVLLFAAAWLALSYPVLSIADVDVLVGPVPVLWIWIFGVWGAIVLCLVVLLEGR